MERRTTVARAGNNIAIFESAERAGGRVHSVPLGNDVRFDVGPTWYWPHQQHMQRLVAELGLEPIEQHIDGDALYELAPSQLQRRGGDMGMLSYRVAGGLARLTDQLSAQLPAGALRLRHAVERIQHDGDTWTLWSRGTAVASRARRLALAIPARVVAATFGDSDWLPSGLKPALLRTPTWMATQAKFVAVYEQPFWRLDGLCGDAFSRIRPLVEMHDASAFADSDAALFGFVGALAPQRAACARTDMVEACVQQLGRIFGDLALRPQTTYLQDWALDAGVCTEMDIRHPAQQHPHIDLAPWSLELQRLGVTFAATEFATQEAGYLEGALQAAELAVQGSLK